MLVHENTDTVRTQLLNLARDLPYLANAKSKPVSVVLAEAKAKLQAIEDSFGGERQPFQRITAAELATGGRFLGHYNVAEPKRMDRREHQNCRPLRISAPSPHWRHDFR